MATPKKSFVLYADNYKAIRNLSTEDKATLLDAIFKYHLDDSLPDMNYTLQAVFGFFQVTFDRDIEKYDRICKRNKENIEKRYHTKSTSGKGGIPEIIQSTKSTDIDIDIDNENENEIFKEKYKKEKKSDSGFVQACDSEEFEVFMSYYPKRLGGNSKLGAWKKWQAVIKKGHSTLLLKHAAKSYQKFCIATDKIGTEYVLMAETFLGPKEHFLTDWETQANAAKKGGSSKQNALDYVQKIADIAASMEAGS